MAETEQQDKPLTVREKIAVRLLFLIMAIVKPSRYAHEWSNTKENIEKLMDAS